MVLVSLFSSHWASVNDRFCAVSCRAD